MTYLESLYVFIKEMKRVHKQGLSLCLVPIIIYLIHSSVISYSEPVFQPIKSASTASPRPPKVCSSSYWSVLQWFWTLIFLQRIYWKSSQAASLLKINCGTGVLAISRVKYAHTG